MKIVLLGDSIRQIGYGTKVPQMLGKDFEVFQPADNCRFAHYTARMLADSVIRDNIKNADIVHWNNGLWDICNCLGDGFFTDVDDYLKQMIRIADILLSDCKRVIFATTTPINKHPEFNGNVDIERYNNTLVPILKAKGIIINDLYATISADIDGYIRDDDHIHLTEMGIDVAARQVCDIIIKTAEELK